MAQINFISWRNLRLFGLLILLILSFLIVDSLPSSHTDIQLQSNSEPSGKSVDISLRIDYSDPDTYTQVITHSGAKEMLLHFQSLDLPDGDTVTVRDPDNNYVFTYPGGPSMSQPDPAFWTTGIAGDTLIIELHKQSSENNDSFGAVMDYYIYVSNNEKLELDFIPESIIGTDDKEDVECFSSSHPEAYANRTPVAKVYYAHVEDEEWVYDEVCTAFRITDGDVYDAGLLIVPNHCIGSSTALHDMVIRFNYEDETCGDTNVSKTYEDYDWAYTSFVATSDYTTGEDWTLFRISGVSVQTYGFIKIDPRPPVYQETIYLVEQPFEKLKELAIYDTENTDDGLCRIDEVLYDGTWHDPDIETGYKCDTEVCTSGSPVIAADTHRVLAMHRGGISTINMGIRFDLIWDDLDDYIAPYKIEGLDGPSGTVNNLDPKTFTWDYEPTADTYRFSLMDGDHSALHNANDMDPATYCTGDTCSYTPEFDWFSGDYTWRVVGHNVSGYGETSDFGSFNIDVLPDQPVLIEPDTTIALIRPDYFWEELDNVVDYRLYVTHPVVGTVINEWIPIGGGDGEIECYSGECSVLPLTHLRTGNHTWYIQARNVSGGGDWSTGTWFRVFNSTLPWTEIEVTSHTHRQVITETQPILTWTEVSNASWYKVYISDSVGKLYNQYHRAADICYGTTCTLDWATYSPLFYEPRGLTDFPTDTWIHFYGMPVNVAGNGDWTGPVDFWIDAP